MTRLVRIARAERGSFLVEALFTALVLGIATLAVLRGLDLAQATSGKTRLRAQAADVAQSALERLRMTPYDDLRRYAATPLVDTITVGEPGNQTTFTYTARTNQPARTDTPGGCATQQARDYLEATVSVTWPTMNGARTVRLDTEIAAPVAAAGDVVLRVVNRDGVAVPGVVASLRNEARGGSATTDATGCARWNQLDASVDYTLSFAHSAGGRWVTPDRVHAFSQVIDVAGEQTRTVTAELDQAGTVPVRFRWRNRGSTTDQFNGAGANPQFVSFAHSRLATPLALPWTPPSGTAYGDVPDLFPFADAYGVYGGSCAAARPPSAATRIAPRATRAGALTVDLYAINVRVHNGTQTDGRPIRPPSDTLLKVVHECGTTWDGIPVQTTSGDFHTIRDQAFPYGTAYTVCAYSPGLKRWDIARGSVKAVNVGTGAGGDEVTLDLARNVNTPTAMCT